MKKTPTSLFSRSAKLLKLGTQLAAKEAIHQVFNQGSNLLAKSKELEHRIEQARMITKELSQLKGAAMKLGQILSLEAQDFLPKEAVDVLSMLQNSATPTMNSNEVIERLKTELGHERFAQLSEIQTTAHAAASLGQVHKAKYKGEWVALKIQYPHIQKTIHSDISGVKKIFPILSKLSGKTVDYSFLFDELEKVLIQEADYSIEAQLLKAYQKHLGQHPYIQTPKLISELSTQTLLVTSWIDAQMFRDWANQCTDSKAKDHIANQLIELFWHELFDWGLVQTDPNYGNFMVKGDQLILLDFGATLQYEAEFVMNYKAVITAAVNRNSDEIIQKSYDFGLLDPRESDECRVLYIKMMDLSARPFQLDQQPFSFETADFSNELRAITMDFIKSIQFTPPPHRIIFIQRKLGGVFQMLRLLGGRYDLSPWIPQLKNDSK